MTKLTKLDQIDRPGREQPRRMQFSSHHTLCLIQHPITPTVWQLTAAGTPARSHFFCCFLLPWGKTILGMIQGCGGVC
jgi:hypothetical protein